jgi:hypothetical protein
VTIDKEASRHWRQRIRDVLNTDWDPIGGCPEDEYDDYVGKVAAMLREQASDQAVIDYLRWVETVHMGISPRDGLEERLLTVMEQLRAIGWLN